MSLDPSLTPREMEVLALLTVGKSNREIATELYMGLSTVKSHLTEMYRKLGVSNRTEAALVGMRTFPMLQGLASQDAVNRRHAVERETPSSAARSAIGPR